jgi:hypothetical protein
LRLGIYGVLLQRWPSLEHLNHARRPHLLLITRRIRMRWCRSMDLIPSVPPVHLAPWQLTAPGREGKKKAPKLLQAKAEPFAPGASMMCAEATAATVTSFAVVTTVTAPNVAQYHNRPSCWTIRSLMTGCVAGPIKRRR